MSETALLQKYVRDRDEAAFTELVRRNVDFVYAAALRQTLGDQAEAEDITQDVFVQLARKAPALTGHTSLVGWLHAATRFAALAARRKNRRRMQREQTLEIMNDAAPETVTWENVRPLIDEAMLDLNETDRQSVLMRYFAGCSLQQIGEQLGCSENAAQKRMARALDQLSAALARRGVPSTAAALSLALAGSGVSAPATLAGSAAAAALAAATTGVFSASGLVLAAKIAAGAAAMAVVGVTVGVWLESNQANARLAKAQQEFASQLADLQGQVKHQADRAAAAEADTARLLAAIDTAKAEREAAAKAAAAAALEAKQKAALVPVPNDYIVQRGDTGQKIAEQTGASAAQLQALNPDVDWARLKVGQKIRILGQP